MLLHSVELGSLPPLHAPTHALTHSTTPLPTPPPPLLLSHTHWHSCVLQLLQVAADGLWVGSSVTLSDLMDQMRSLIKTQPSHTTSACTALLNQLKYFAGNQIRNTASVGGNIVTGSPISDTCPLYMACGATFVLQGQGMPERQVLAEDFFLGYRSANLPLMDLIVCLACKL